MEYDLGKKLEYLEWAVGELLAKTERTEQKIDAIINELHVNIGEPDENEDKDEIDVKPKEDEE